MRRSATSPRESTQSWPGQSAKTPQTPPAVEICPKLRSGLATQAMAKLRLRLWRRAPAMQRMHRQRGLAMDNSRNRRRNWFRNLRRCRRRRLWFLASPMPATLFFGAAAVALAGVVAVAAALDASAAVAVAAAPVVLGLDAASLLSGNLFRPMAKHTNPSFATVNAIRKRQSCVVLPNRCHRCAK